MVLIVRMDYKVRKYLYPQEYRDGIEEIPEDYGLLELERDIGNYSGIIEMKMYDQDEIDNLEYYIYGYLHISTE
jgi:hypothetical protein